MAEQDLILAIDNGTQSLKALVFDAEGRVQASVRVPFESYFSRHPGWAEQVPEVFWDALCLACQRLWLREGLLRERLAGVALTTQRGTVVNMDRRGKPLRPAILWLDQRRSKRHEPLGGLWGILFKLLGLNGTVAYLQAEAEANWLQTQQPEVWAKTHKYLLLSGYLAYCLTGRYVDSIGCQVGYTPFDYKRLKRPASWSWRYRVIPVAPALLPELIPPGQPLGEVTRSASHATGLPAGLPVIAAAADKACEVLGCGALSPGIGCLSYGTTATINVTSAHYHEAIPLLPAYPAAIEGYHSLEVQIFRGYWMVSWFKEEFGHLEQQQAAHAGLCAEALLDDLIRDIPAGASGLLLQPYWTPGLKNPGPEAKGAVIGFGDVHTRGHLYRAILEGIAYALREGKERIEKRTRQPIEQLRVTGGGSSSDVAMQVTADVFGLPAARSILPEACALGAAIDAAVGLKFYASFDAAVQAMTQLGDWFEPQPDTHALYDQLYRQVYQKMYRRLKPLYERIRAITGYPD